LRYYYLFKKTAAYSAYKDAQKERRAAGGDAADTAGDPSDDSEQDTKRRPGPSQPDSDTNRECVRESE
jgi:hypothetical protein